MIPYQQAVQGLQDLPLKDHVMEGWLCENTARLLAQAEDRSHPR